VDRLARDMEQHQENRRKLSRRRMTLEASDVDYINDKNEAFNKKIKRSFDKYTVEIRQNLERGTAI
jgi:t-SNARE complex subunit (syntaxin)